MSRPGTSGPGEERPVQERLSGSLGLRRLGQNEWAFVPPDCAIERQMDLEEAQHMQEMGEEEIARDELLYLVADCHGFLTAHNQLGELALAASNVRLARGHFGYAYENALRALPPRFRGRLSAQHEGNAPFFAAGHNLARCLVALGKLDAAQAVLDKLAELDRHDADTRDLLQQLREFRQGGGVLPEAGGCAAGAGLVTLTLPGGLVPPKTDGPVDDEDGEDEDDDDDDDE